MTQNQIIYEESVNRVMYVDFRVFVFGVDVTSYVVSSIKWQYSDRNGFNTASFSLQNAFDNFVITAENLTQAKNNFRDPESENKMYSEMAKKQIMLRKQELDQGFDTEHPMYPMGERNIIFHQDDTVRIFIANSLSPNASQWMNVFTGYIDNAQKTSDHRNGASTISISCNCIKKPMQKMRVSMQPFHGKLQAFEIMNSPKSFFADLVNVNEYNHPFHSKSYENAMTELMQGSVSNASRDDDGQLIKPSKGVGQMLKGDFYYFDPEAKDHYIQKWDTKGEKDEKVNDPELLKTWYNLLLFGEKGDWLTTVEMNTIGINSYPTGKHSPDMQKFYMLLPKGGTHTADLVERHLSEGVENHDFSSRYEIITDFSEKIDYQWWTTGNGDVVFEFPMYEFMPSDFGLQTLMTINETTIDDVIVDEMGDIPTTLTATGGYISTNESAGGGQEFGKGLMAANIPRVIITNPALSARLGVHNVNKNFPTVLNREALIILAHVEYFKMLSANSSMDVNFSWKPWMFPNKPFYHVREQRMATTVTVSNNITLFTGADTSVSCSYVRKRDKNGKFNFMTGGGSVLASYYKSWASALGNQVNTGAITVDVTTGKTSSKGY